MDEKTCKPLVVTGVEQGELLMHAGRTGMHRRTRQMPPEVKALTQEGDASLNWACTSECAIERKKGGQQT